MWEKSFISIIIKRKITFEINFLQFSQSCWTKIILLGNIQFLLLIYLLRLKYLQHSSWLHSTLCTFIYENGGCIIQQVLPQNFERNWNLVFKAFDCAFKRLCKRIFLSFLPTHNAIEPRKRKANPLKSSNYFLYIFLI